jgi:acetolactate synthase-1/2/3 large subunit
MDSETQPRIAAEDYLEALAAHDIEHLFCNPGTDFAPIVEAFARAARSNRKVPRPMVVPHENAALSMAHGYTMVTGRPQAVMLHTNVGTANAINMLIDASRDRVPVLLTSGRTPFTEAGASGSRSAYIHWAQEMFDQAGMLREVVKWDYEMKRGDQAAAVVDRALELAMASPKGPVYLSLPREVLGEVVEAPSESNRARRVTPRAPVPSASDVEQLAEWIATAQRPVVITGLLGQDPRDAVVLSRLAERWALPIVPYNTRYFAISANHPMFQGSMPGPLLDDADLVIVIEADVPWMPSKEAPPAGARIVQIGVDPLYSRYPMRGFPSDLTITASALSVLEALEQALAGRPRGVEDRRTRLVARSQKLHEQWRNEAEQAGRGNKNTLAWLNHCLREVVDRDTIVINEYSFRQEYCPLETPGSLFAVSAAGGLGWGFGASLGAKLAASGRQVLSVLGDGAYMFANPTACHYVAQMQNLPVLTVIYNNALYNAVRRATLDMYEHGAAALDDGRLLADLPAPNFEKIALAHDGHGERVEQPADLPAALRRAAAAVRSGQQALVNVICPP